MKIKSLLWAIALTVVILFGVAADVDLNTHEKVAIAQSGDPTAVAQAFYDEYLSYLRDTGNPVNDRIYRDSPYVSQQLISVMDTRIDEGVSADPFLCAQNIPDMIAVFDNQSTGDRAVIVMTTNFTAHFVTVDMVFENGSWKLDAVACGDRINSVRPVETFYNWYIRQVQSGADPLSDNSFQDRAELSPNLVADVAQQLATDSAVDPFVCAENGVDGTEVVEVLTWQPETRMLLATNLPDNYITVTVAVNNAQWTIQSIECGDHLSPRGVTNDFYAWYLDYSATQGNPLTDRAYQNSDLLAWSLIQTTNRILEEGIAFDPFLCAENVPDSVSSQLLGSDGRHASVQVTTSLASPSFNVSLIQTGPVWQIDEVRCPTP